MALGYPLHPPVSTPAEDSPVLGTLGNWTLVERLSQSRWSRVYRARPRGRTDSAGDYAIKLANADELDGWLAVRLLRCEAAVSSVIVDPNLISVLAQHLQDPPYYTVMPYLRGATLAERQAAGERLSVEQVLDLARQAAGGLRALHGRGLRHGDVKPANLHLGEQGHVTVLDLGYVRRMGTARVPTGDSLRVTLTYAAPEVYSSLETLDGASDVYSLGVTLFQTLCGRLPFEAPTTAELIRPHQVQPPPDVRVYQPDVTEAVADLLRDMLAKRPQQRPDVAQLLDRLGASPIPVYDERFAA